MSAETAVAGGDTVAPMCGGTRGAAVGRPSRWLAAVAPMMLLVACTGDDANPTVAEGPVDGSTVTTTTIAGETRPVPTVPPSTLPGEVTTVAGTEPGVVDASPTIAPAPVDPNAPTTSVVAPTTDLVGDPQPNPDTTGAPPPPPPPTAADDPDACERLADFDIVGVIADTASVATTGELVADEVCRYAAGAFVAEVHFVPAAEIRDDWNKRDGIEPVGEVASDAVGFGSFIPPGSPPGAGYTIALEGGSLGVIVAVTGTGDARRVAGQIAIFANQAG